MTIPNAISLFRVLLTPLLIWLLLDYRIGEALLVFFIAGATDALDGFVARVFHQKSKIGTYLDPLADKILLTSSFILLGYLGLLPSWLVIITVSRDVIIALGVATLVLHQIPLEINPSLLSKLTTLVQIITICACLSAAYFALPVLNNRLLYITTAILSLISGFHYMFLGIRLWGEVDKDEDKESE